MPPSRGSKNVKTPMIVRCPTCKKSRVYDENNPYRPFCSERCRTHDVASWADEQFKIPGEKINPEPVSITEEDEENS